MNKTVLAVLAGVLVGGGAIAAYQSLSTPYADVVSSTPITEKEPIYGDVLSSTAVTETRTGSRQVCEDVAVEKREPERFGNKDGAVVGAVVGGLLGSQVGGGSGKKVATVAGAVAGGFAGREIDERHTGGKKYTEIEQQCHTVTEPREEVIGYDVQYRSEGEVSTTRVDKKPGAQILLGERDKVVGYDVTWRYKDQTGSLVMDEDPGDRLPIENGVIAVAAKDTPPQG
ncbi:glycine zipper 2TM domain-containing protein [Arenimonas daejeonensis]|uniref:glycine zipper 2TM domain-containing protein n=1 Tax=Arenimonas daejeonensis TaxID=370777 RepID=UPI0011BEBFD1|nr:glycine zipper 2TM domain-containing protein [Arenimonas daejeonensis]